jgi:hypothetical protein
MDSFVVITPLLLLGVIALLGFVGCDLVFPSQAEGKAVEHVQTVVKSASAGESTITADALSLQGGELIVATVQWASAAVVPPVPALTGGNFAPVVGGGPFPWNNMRVQTFVAANPDHNTQVTVQVKLAGGSSVTWNLCVSAYKTVDQDAPVYSPQQNGPGFVGTNPQAPPLTIVQGDLVHAVAFAANGDGTFPGNNALTPGPGFTAESQTTNPLVEDGTGSNPIVAQATNTNPDPTGRSFLPWE